MTSLFATDLIQDLTTEKFEQLSHYFNDGLITRINKSPSENYRIKRITSRLMLIQIFTALNIDLKYLKNIHYNQHGKLILSGLNYNISLSYSGNKVVCLISDEPLGMDVENIQTEPKKYCIQLLENLTSKQIKDKMNFYSLWTQIESIVKIYNDKGLKDIFYGDLFNQKHYTQSLLFNNHYLISTSSLHQLKYLEPIKTLFV